MVELIGPIARLQALIDELEMLSRQSDPRFDVIGMALCFLQYAADLLSEPVTPEA
jgi:hypothetical protein